MAYHRLGVVMTIKLVNYSERKLSLFLVLIMVLACSCNAFASDLRTNHFNTVWSGNGLQHMNFFVVDAEINGIPLTANDEIAVFDNNLCVGKVTLNSPINQYVSFVASLDDPTTTALDGYTPNHSVIFKVWIDSLQTEYSQPALMINYTDGSNVFVIGATAIVAVNNDSSTHSVNTLIQPVNSGTVSGNGSFLPGTLVTLTAVPNQNYSFLHWTDSSGNILSSQLSYEFLMSVDNVTFNAVFLPDEFPQSLHCEAQNAQNKLVWSKPFRLSLNTQDFLGYRIYRDNGSINQDIITDTTFYDKLVSNGIAYSYAVSAVYSNPQHESALSDTANIIAYVDPITSLTAVSNCSTIRLNWTPPNNIANRLSHFLIYRNANFFTNCDSNSFIDTQIENGVTYYYKIKAVYENPLTLSAFSDSTSVNAVLNPPSNLIASANPTFIRLQWNAPALLSRNFAGYQIYRNSTLLNALYITDTLYTDYQVSPNSSYTYFVTAVYNNPESESNPSNSITVQTVGTDNPIPFNTQLIGNYPNPFNPHTTISFSVNNNKNVKIQIFNIKGELVKTLLNSSVKPGLNQIIWKGKDNQDNNVSSGIYFCKMTNSNYQSTKKMFLIK